jgi:hypothetical protein
VNNKNRGKGLSFWEALAKYSSGKFWNEYMAQRRDSEERSNSPAKFTQDPSFLEGLIHVSNIVSEHARNSSKEKELRNKVINQFKLNFNSKKLFAYGYSIPRKANDNPNLIRSDVIANGEINWGDSSIKGNGLEFVGVMVFKEQLINELNESLNSIAIKKELPIKSNKGKGRPSNKGLIVSIYLEEKEKGNIKYSNPKNKIFSDLAIIIAEKGGIPLNEDKKHFKGLGYEAMNKAIGDFIDKEKERLSF